jgi:rhodanese-related sulfurtransferase
MGVRTVDDLLAEARAHLRRLSPMDAAEHQHRGALIIDVRLDEQRRRDGTVPGARVISLNHLEWRLDPSSGSRIAEARDHSVEVVVLCDEGYCSSLAAARLQALGLHRATDVIGGFQAWRAAGLPVDAVEH